MASPKEHLQQIIELGLDELLIEVSNEDEAKATLKDIRNLQKKLRQIKRNINLDMKSIRVVYKNKKANAGSGASALFSIFGKRKIAASIRADSKRHVTAEMNEALAPYEKLKLDIDDMFVQMEDVKIKLQDYIEQEKQLRNQSKNSASDRVMKDVQPITATTPEKTVDTELLNKVKKLLKAGDKTQARKLLGQSLKTNPKNVEGWILLSQAVDEPDRKRQALEYALKLARR